MKKLLPLFFLLITAIATAGCAGLLRMQDPDLARANTLFQQKKYNDALAGYRQILTSRSRERDAQARYAIAFTLAYYDNPQRDYGKALEAFDDFLRRYPDHELVQEAQNWKHTIKLILEEIREKDQLKMRIEQLQRLDIRHEEKRRGK